MTKQELLAVVDNPLSDSQQRTDAQALLDKLNTGTAEFAAMPEMMATCFRNDANSERRAEKFAEARERYKSDPAALNSFTPDREHLLAKRDVYDQHGGDVIGQAYDEDIPALLAAKGRGYFGTVAYFVERKGMTQEAASQAALRHMERQHTAALIDDELRSGKRVKDCTTNTVMHLSQFASKETKTK